MDANMDVPVCWSCWLLLTGCSYSKMSLKMCHSLIWFDEFCWWAEDCDEQSHVTRLREIKAENVSFWATLAISLEVFLLQLMFLGDPDEKEHADPTQPDLSWQIEAHLLLTHCSGFKIPCRMRPTAEIPFARAAAVACGSAIEQSDASVSDIRFINDSALLSHKITPKSLEKSFQRMWYQLLGWARAPFTVPGWPFVFLINCVQYIISIFKDFLFPEYLNNFDEYCKNGWWWNSSVRKLFYCFHSFWNNDWWSFFLVFICGASVSEVSTEASGRDLAAAPRDLSPRAGAYARLNSDTHHLIVVH